MNNDIFSKLRNERDYKSYSSKKADFFFRLNIVDNIIVLDIVSADRKTKISTPNSFAYSGVIAKVLEQIQELEKNDAFKITWGTVGGFVFLCEQTVILHSILKCNNIINGDGKDVEVRQNIQQIIIDISEDAGIIKSDLWIGENKLVKPVFINDEFLLDNAVLYFVESVGDKFDILNDFSVTLDKTKFEQYLSLFFNSFPNITIKFSNGYKIEDQITMPAKGLLYIENIDSHKNLFLRVLLTVPDTDPFIINDYSLDRVVSINHITKTIKIISVDTTDSVIYFDTIEKKLDFWETEARKKNGYKRIKSLFIISPDIAGEFLKNELGELLEMYNLLGEDKLEFYEIKKIKPFVISNFSSGINYFEGAATVDVDGKLINIFELLDEFRRKSYITLADNKKGIINRSYMDKLGRLFKKKDDVALVSFFDIPLMNGILDDEQIEAQFKIAKDFYKGFNNLSEYPFPEIKVEATLRQYQQDGFKWLRYLYDNSLGGCLADDMGLGKTIQSIALLSTVYPKCEAASLIIVPRSLLYNWKNELDRFAPNLTHSFYYGNEKNIDEAMKSNIVITTYETIRGSIDDLKTKDFHIIILDESQKIKNIDSAISKSVMKLKSEKRFALSGTPIENHLGELYSLFKFINPGMFGSGREFNEKYFNPIQKQNNSEALKELKTKIYPFILRRLKKDVLTELPERIEQELIIEMNDDHKAYYEKRRDLLYNLVKQNIKINGIKSSQFHIFQAFNELRQISSMPEIITDLLITSTKKEILVDQIEELIVNGHKALIFANFLGILETIEGELNARGIEYVKITGQTANRQELVERFQNSDKCKVFLATLKTGGVGLNLTAADFVYIYDPWWNSSAENQAIDRAHRIGQKNTVFSYKLITKGTIEEKIVELQRSKSNLINSLLNSDGVGAKSINEADVEFLLGAEK